MSNSQYRYIKQWREAQPKINKPCAHCGDSFDSRFASYCSARCKTRAWRARHKPVVPTLLCDFCSEPIQNKGSRFCSAGHRRRFWSLVRAKKEVAVKVGAATTLFTRRYDDIAGVRRRWLEANG